MNLKRVLTPDVVTTNLQGTTKEEVIEELLDILVGTNKVKDRAKALQCLLEREKKMSTGMQHGIAIPHGKTGVVDSLVVCVGVHKEGVDFKSLDRQKSHIFVMTLSPENRSGPHLQFLGEVSKLLNDADTRKKVREAKNPQEIVDILTQQ